jgi:hypothetical protein
MAGKFTRFRTAIWDANYNQWESDAPGGDLSPFGGRSLRGDTRGCDCCSQAVTVTEEMLAEHIVALQCELTLAEHLRQTFFGK